MTETRHTICGLCDASCGLAVELDGDQVVRVRGDREDPLSRGYLCAKARAAQEILDDPDRLRSPQRRVGDRWEPVGWDEALDEAAARIHGIQAAHGRDAVAQYLGTQTFHSYGAALFSSVFQGVLGSRNRYSAASVDALPRMLVSMWMYGSQALVPVPDVDRTDLLLIVGSNPLVSNGSAWTVPDLPRRLKALRERGGALVVVDPVRTRTARAADQHLFIRPGTDALFLLALIHALAGDGLPDDALLADVDRLIQAVEPFAPEAVADACGIAAADIRDLARRLGAAGSAACHGRMGTSTQEFGAVATWALDVLNALTGNLDRPGGAMFTTPAVDLAGLAARTGETGSFAGHHSRVGGLPEAMGELPVAALADEIATPGEGQVRGLVTHAGNPVLSIPDGRRLAGALDGLDFFVAIDLYRNETTRFADLILPPTFGFQRDVYPLLFLGMAVRNTARYAAALLPRGPEERHDWEIFAGLARRLARDRGGLWRLAGLGVGALARWLGPRGVLALLLRFGPHGKGLFGRGLTLGELERQPHGVDLGALEPRLPGRLATADRRVALLPEPIRGDLDRVRRQLTTLPPPGDDDRLLLVGRRHPRSFNSWMHNIDRLARGDRRFTLQVHPEDAGTRGIADGASVHISTDAGRISAPAEVTDAVMPGTVCLPHGWGHGQPGTALAIANQRPGANVNDLIDAGDVDDLAGTSRLSGIPVRVSPADDR